LRGSTHILVVEDNLPVAALLRSLLETEGYIVHEARNGDQLRNAMKSLPISLITLDLNLGGEDGLGLCREIRLSHDIPIIIVTGKSEDVDRIVGLEVGADDYISKPFNLREVLARVRAVLRRFDPATTQRERQRIAFSDYVLDLSRRELTKLDGERIALTTAEFNLLCVFAQRPRHVFPRDALIDALKGDATTSFDRAIDTLVARIRKKIEPDISNPTFIKTVRGVGYIFM
jgi:two-component system, OmpR family, response regulator